jgi:hypothetical protein
MLSLASWTSDSLASTSNQLTVAGHCLIVIELSGAMMKDCEDDSDMGRVNPPPFPDLHHSAKGKRPT